ncbi:MAG: hypothetical protein WAQ33_09485 [Gaiellaceae bacterium]
MAAAGSRRLAGARWSRYCSERFDLPDPVDDPRGFADRLESVLADGRFSVLLPGGDPALLAILGARRRLEALVKLGLPSDEAVRRSLSKTALIEAAAAADLPAPRSIVCESLSDAESALAEIGLPLLVKPAQSVISLAGRLNQATATFVDGLASLPAAVAHCGLPCTLQRFEANRPVFSCGGVLAGKRMLGFAFSRYHRTWRPLVGKAAYSETLVPPAGLESKVCVLVTELGWEGIFELELVGDGAETFSAIDFNPRSYGSMSLAVRAGANLPSIWCDWLLGHDPVPVRARPEYRYRFEEADLRYLGWQLGRGRVRAAASVLRPHRRTAHAFFQLNDPGPAAAETIWIASRAVRKAWIKLVAVFRG